MKERKYLQTTCLTEDSKAKLYIVFKIQQRKTNNPIKNWNGRDETFTEEDT